MTGPAQSQPSPRTQVRQPGLRGPTDLDDLLAIACGNASYALRAPWPRRASGCSTGDADSVDAESIDHDAPTGTDDLERHPAASQALETRQLVDETRSVWLG